MTVNPPRWYFSLRSPHSRLAYREPTENAPDDELGLDDEIPSSLLVPAGDPGHAGGCG